MSQLPRQHHDLSAVVTLVGNEIGKHVRDIEREISPGVRPRGRNLTAVLESESKQAGDPAAAAPQSTDQLEAAHSAPIDRGRDDDAVRRSQCLDPHAASVMNVAGDHADRAPGRTGDRGRPQRYGQILDQENCRSLVRGPGIQDTDRQSPRRRDRMRFQCSRAAG